MSARVFTILMAGLTGLAIAGSVSAPAAAARPVTLDNLKGVYNGSYSSTTHMDRSGAIRVQITYDKIPRGSLARVLKGTVRFGRKTYGGMVGTYNQNTQDFQMTGRIGTIRRPRGAVVIAGKFLDAHSIGGAEAQYAISMVGQDEERGDYTAAR